MRFTNVAMPLALLFLVACQPEQNVPTAVEFEAERGELMKRVAERKAKKERQEQPAPVKVASSVPAGSPGDNAFGGGAAGFTYEPIGMRDPFRSFEWERLEVEESPRGPLEEYDIAQLSVVAIVWNTGHGRALIEDPSGQSYIVEKGMRIGKNDGRVVDIDDNLVIVKETYVDFLGHETKKDVEMRIRLSEGG